MRDMPSDILKQFSDGIKGKNILFHEVNKMENLLFLVFWLSIVFLIPLVILVYFPLKLFPKNTMTVLSMRKESGFINILFLLYWFGIICYSMFVYMIFFDKEKQKPKGRSFCPFRLESGDCKPQPDYSPQKCSGNPTNHKDCFVYQMHIHAGGPGDFFGQHIGGRKAKL